VGDLNRYNDIQTSWLCIRQGETIATKMTSTYWKNKRNFFVNSTSEYFKDDDELVKKIQSGAYSWNPVSFIRENKNPLYLSVYYIAYAV
jgi:hypothetical protein